ncbi:hypothetical protein [Epilithonimonas sp.]|uniref:hypothetical protein n=1 Tax=Epilithonimonas sp. TaxID=2894511 RepID=UPI0028A14D46|nr:hypothetical protein [Epilithonimonas sp.]
MKKYLALIYLSLSVMSLAQFKDNVFNQEQSKVETQPSRNLNAAAQGESVQPFDSNTGASDTPTESLGPGNPGEPVPIDGYVPLLLIGSLGLMVYYHRRNKRINI